MEDGIFAVIAEFKEQSPILMETEGRHSSFEAAMKRRNEMSARPDVVRVCVVQIASAPVWAGNDLLIEDMKRMQK